MPYRVMRYGELASVRASRILLGGALAAAVVASVAAADTERVPVPERISVTPEASLVLNGSGIHTEASLDRYVVALYLSTRRSSLREILSDPGPKRIRLTFLRDMRTAALGETLLEAVAAHYTASEMESLKAPLDELLALLDRVGRSRKGSSISFDYLPGSGTSLLTEDGRRTKAIRGSDLYAALLRVWVGEDAVDRRLRRALVGGQPDTLNH